MLLNRTTFTLQSDLIAITSTSPNVHVASHIIQSLKPHNKIIATLTECFCYYKRL